MSTTAVITPDASEEKKLPEWHDVMMSEGDKAGNIDTNESMATDPSKEQVLAPNCDDVLESMDSCVGCVEGVDLQHDFEEGLGEIDLAISEAQTATPPLQHHQSLSEAEVASIRLQVLENTAATATPNTTVTTSPHLDLLNLCGTDDDAEMDSVAWKHENAATDPERTCPSEQVASPLQCAVCLDEALDSSKPITFAKLPCCEEKEKTNKICTACILMLATPTPDGSCRIGRCLCCRSWIRVETPKSVDLACFEISTVTVTGGHCSSCNQVKQHLVLHDEESICDACFVGRSHPLLYECQQCHKMQRIPHPMYRYQPHSNEFGTLAWACQGECAKFTNWRICPDQISLVPVGDAPECWGDDVWATARTRVQEARQALSVIPTLESTGSGCTLL